MKEYLDHYLRRKIEINECEENKYMPFIFVGLYYLYSLEIDGIQWLMDEPKKSRMAFMRKIQRQLEKLTEEKQNIK